MGATIEAVMGRVIPTADRRLQPERWLSLTSSSKWCQALSQVEGWTGNLRADRGLLFKEVRRTQKSEKEQSCVYASLPRRR